MSKVVPSSPSHRRNADSTASGTALSQEWYTGSSYKKSYSLISSNEYSAVDLRGKITGETEVETPASHTRTRRTARFLKGPIPLEAIAQAACLPGKALAVYLAVHHRCDLENRSNITLPAALLDSIGREPERQSASPPVPRASGPRAYRTQGGYRHAHLAHIERSPTPTIISTALATAR